MMRFLALQSPAHAANNGVYHRLHESVDLEELATQLSEAATTGAAVHVPLAVPEVIRPGLLYVRPSAWAAWWLIELSDNEWNDISQKQGGANGLLALVAAIAQGLKK